MLDLPVVLYMRGDILYATLPWRGSFVTSDSGDQRGDWQ